MRRILIAAGVIILVFFGASRSQTQQAQKTWLPIGAGVGFVAKVDVSNLDASTNWYRDKLGLVPDPRFNAPSWRQLKIPGLGCDVAIGLNLNPGKLGTAGATATFVVKDIVKEQKRLTSLGVNIGPVTPVGEGVCLAFFTDPDGNQLGLRQNKCPLKPPKAG